MIRPDPTRRALLTGLLAAGVSGCAQDSPYALFSAGLKASRRAPVQGYPVTADEIAALPYATLGARIGEGDRFVLVLTRYDGSQLQWVSSDRLLLTTRGGRLMQTVGLARDLAAVELITADPLAEREDSWNPQPGTAQRLVDLHAPDEFSVPVASRWRTLGEEKLTILGRQRPTYHVQEIQTTPKWRWSCVNDYWIGEHDGRVWRTRQRYCPQVPPIELELLKPAA
jgi:hypothetical protein